MTLTLDTPAATDKQLAFLHTLLAKRSYPVAGSTEAEARILARLEDVMGQKFVAKAEASDCITYLLARPVKAAASATAGPLAAITPAKFALELGDKLRFFEVVQRPTGKRYLNEMLGAPGDFRRLHVSYADQIKVIARLQGTGAKVAMMSFANHFTVCAKCCSPLTDATSRELGLGPTCRQVF